MKTIILYATKYGAAREIAQRIANEIDGAVTHDLKQSDVPSLAEYDCIIVGGSLYAGMLRKEAKLFISQNADVLKTKKLGLFLSGIDETREKEFFEANISQDVLQNAKAAMFLGGLFDPKQAGFIERFLMKVVAKQSGYIDTINNSKIGKFVEIMKE